MQVKYTFWYQYIDIYWFKEFIDFQHFILQQPDVTSLKNACAFYTSDNFLLAISFLGKILLWRSFYQLHTLRLYY